MQNENLQNVELVSKNGCGIPFGPETDLLGGFLKKGIDSNFNSSFVFQDLMSALPKIESYNILRRHCLSVFTDSSIVELPSSDDVVVWHTGKHETNDGEVVKIELSEAYAKWKIPRHIFYKMHNYQDYLMSMLYEGVSQLELEMLMKRDSLKDKLKDSWFKVDGGTLPEASSTVGNFDVLLKFFNSLSPRYRHNARWMMSSQSLAKIIGFLEDKDEIYLNGMIKLFGKPVEVVEELDDLVLLADFKQAMVLAERLNPKIEMHNCFDNPSQVGVSLPVSVGLGVVNKKAIKVGTV